MKRIAALMIGTLLLSGCQTLLDMPIGPAEADPFDRYDKTVDTQTVRDCLDGDDELSGQPGCFYQKRDRKDAEEREPPAPYGE